MSHVASTAEVRQDGGRVRVISLLAVVMVLVSLWSAYELYLGDELSISASGGVVVAITLAIWLVYGALFVGAVIVLQRYARRPSWTVALALSWGGLVCLLCAGKFNDAISSALGATSTDSIATWTTGPVIEQTLQATGVVLLALVPVVRRLRAIDGLFYGVVVGIGFQVLENVHYTLATVFDTGGAGGIATIVLLRGLIGVVSHWAWTGVIGAAIGWVVEGGPEHRVRRVLGAVLASLGVMTLHGLSNKFALDNQIALTLLVSLVSLVVFVVVLLAAQRHEKRRLTELAVAHDGWGVLDTAALTAGEGGRGGGKRERAQLRYAYTRDQFGPEHPITRKAAAKLG